MKEVWTCLASLMGVVAFLQTLIHTLIPGDVLFSLSKLLHRLLRSSSSYCYFDITEIDGVSTNELYNAVHLYLSSSPSLSLSASRLSLSRPLNSSAFTFSLSPNDRLVDTFRGSPAAWEHVVTHRHPSSSSFSWRPLPDEKRAFTLTLPKKDRLRVLHPYLDHIMARAADLRRKNQDRLLYTNSRGGGGSLDGRGHPWDSVPFKHPSTFDTLAMDPCRKQEIMDDLRDFADGKGFYERTGRAWKRGYLLYGPPGTGKSSMIAAMANFVGYDIYDLELTEVRTNSELRKLLMKTTSKSIIVIEDIDCSIDLSNRVAEEQGGGKKKVVRSRSSGGHGHGHGHEGVNEESGAGAGKTITLSGLLNFTDGLWSCCGSERIFVFTTNHIEKLDPALLRSGRMDMHIFMSYCSFPALKILMRNYLGLEEGEVAGELMRELEEVVERAEMTPADISEVLIKNRRRREKERAVRELLGVLKGRMEAEEGKKRGEEGGEVEKRALDSPREEGEGGRSVMENGNVKVEENKD